MVFVITMFESVAEVAENVIGCVPPKIQVPVLENEVPDNVIVTGRSGEKFKVPLLVIVPLFVT